MSEWRLDSFGEELDREPDYDDGTPPPRPRRRLWRRFILVLLVVAVGGSGVLFWQAYRGFRHTAETEVAPLIRADLNPTRVRPDQPGGMEVPHQDRLVLQDLTAANGRGGSAEQLLPPPEEPMARPATSPAPGTPGSAGTPVPAAAQPAAPAAAAPASAAPLAADAGEAARRASGGAPGAAATTTAAANPAERRPEPLISRASPAPAQPAEAASASPQPGATAESETSPDLIARVLMSQSEEDEGLVAAAPPEAGSADPRAPGAPLNLVARPGSASAPQQAQPGAAGPAQPATQPTGPAQPAAQPTTAAPAAQVASAAARPAAAAPVTAPAPAAHRPSPPPRAAAEPASPAAASAAPPAAAVRPAPGGSARVQLAAVPTAEKAREEWGRLVQRNRAELGALQMSTQAVEVNGQTMYRVLAGPLDVAGARTLCSQLKARGTDCIVRP